MSGQKIKRTGVNFFISIREIGGMEEHRVMLGNKIIERFRGAGASEKAEVLLHQLLSREVQP